MASALDDYLRQIGLSTDMLTNSSSSPSSADDRSRSGDDADGMGTTRGSVRLFAAEHGTLHRKHNQENKLSSGSPQMITTTRDETVADSEIHKTNSTPSNAALASSVAAGRNSNELVPQRKPIRPLPVKRPASKSVVDKRNGSVQLPLQKSSPTLPASPPLESQPPPPPPPPPPLPSPVMPLTKSLVHKPPQRLVVNGGKEADSQSNRMPVKVAAADVSEPEVHDSISPVDRGVKERLAGILTNRLARPAVGVQEIITDHTHIELNNQRPQHRDTVSSIAQRVPDQNAKTTLLNASREDSNKRVPADVIFDTQIRSSSVAEHSMPPRSVSPSSSKFEIQVASEVSKDEELNNGNEQCVEFGNSPVTAVTARVMDNATMTLQNVIKEGSHRRASTNVIYDTNGNDSTVMTQNSTKPLRGAWPEGSFFSSPLFQSDSLMPTVQSSAPDNLQVTEELGDSLNYKPTTSSHTASDGRSISLRPSTNSGSQDFKYIELKNELDHCTSLDVPPITPRVPDDNATTTLRNKRMGEYQRMSADVIFNPQTTPSSVAQPSDKSSQERSVVASTSFRGDSPHIQPPVSSSTIYVGAENDNTLGRQKLPDTSAPLTHTVVSYSQQTQKKDENETLQQQPIDALSTMRRFHTSSSTPSMSRQRDTTVSHIPLMLSVGSTSTIIRSSSVQRTTPESTTASPTSPPTDDQVPAKSNQLLKTTLSLSTVDGVVIGQPQAVTPTPNFVSIIRIGSSSSTSTNISNVVHGVPQNMPTVAAPSGGHDTSHTQQYPTATSFAQSTATPINHVVSVNASNVSRITSATGNGSTNIAQDTNVIRVVDTVRAGAAVEGVSKSRVSGHDVDSAPRVASHFTVIADSPTAHISMSNSTSCPPPSRADLDPDRQSAVHSASIHVGADTQQAPPSPLQMNSAHENFPDMPDGSCDTPIRSSMKKYVARHNKNKSVSFSIGSNDDDDDEQHILSRDETVDDFYRNTTRHPTPVSNQPGPPQWSQTLPANGTARHRVDGFQAQTLKPPSALNGSHSNGSNGAAARTTVKITSHTFETGQFEQVMPRPSSNDDARNGAVGQSMLRKTRSDSAWPGRQKSANGNNVDIGNHVDLTDGSSSPGSRDVIEERPFFEIGVVNIGDNRGGTVDNRNGLSDIDGTTQTQRTHQENASKKTSSSTTSKSVEHSEIPRENSMRSSPDTRRTRNCKVS